MYMARFYWYVILTFPITCNLKVGSSNVLVHIDTSTHNKNQLVELHYDISHGFYSKQMQIIQILFIKCFDKIGVSKSLVDHAFVTSGWEYLTLIKFGWGRFPVITQKR